MKHYIELSIPVKSENEAAFAIAALQDFDFEGMEEKEGELNIFFRQNKLDRPRVLNVLQELGLNFIEREHTEKNWNQEWESGFTPVVIGDYAAIRAHFHEQINGVKHEIIITPKMSFGTGHHATTSLMMLMMKDINLVGKSVLDFGTGTGVLAILAFKSGAAKITAIDNDEWSINNAKENFRQNNADRIVLIQEDSLEGLQSFDVVLANINLNVLTALAKSLAEVTIKGSSLLISGFYTNDFHHISEVFAAENFRLLQQKDQDRWNCLLLEKL